MELRMAREEQAVILLQIIWVAAHDSLRRMHPRRSIIDSDGHEWTVIKLWSCVHDITAELGYPPAPRMGQVWS